MSVNILALNESGDEVIPREYTRRSEANRNHHQVDQYNDNCNITNKKSENNNNNNNNSNIVNKKGGFRIDDILFSVSRNVLRNPSSSLSSSCIPPEEDEPSSPSQQQQQPQPAVSPSSETSHHCLSSASSPTIPNTSGGESPCIDGMQASPILYLRHHQRDELDDSPTLPPHSAPLHDDEHHPRTKHHPRTNHHHSYTILSEPSKHQHHHHHEKQRQHRGGGGRFNFVDERISPSMIDCTTQPRSMSPTLVHPSQQDYSRLCSDSKLFLCTIFLLPVTYLVFLSLNLLFLLYRSLYFAVLYLLKLRLLFS